MAGAVEKRHQATPPGPRVDFHAFVNWDFRHRKSLKGWRATSVAIQRSIEQWYPGRSPHTVVENGTAAELRNFLHTLPTGSDCNFSIVYLASHQSPAGEWDFVQNGLARLNEIVAGSHIPRHPARIVIVDACYAAAVQRDPIWEREWRSPSVFAALDSEEVLDLNFRNPQPLDLRRRYPAAIAWLNENLGRKWDGRLSFFGFVWVQTFVTSTAAPGDLKGWEEFLRRCEATAAEFRTNGDRRLASQVTFRPCATSPSPKGAPPLR